MPKFYEASCDRIGKEKRLSRSLLYDYQAIFCTLYCLGINHEHKKSAYLDYIC